MQKWSARPEHHGTELATKVDETVRGSAAVNEGSNDLPSVVDARCSSGTCSWSINRAELRIHVEEGVGLVEINLQLSKDPPGMVDRIGNGRTRTGNINGAELAVDIQETVSAMAISEASNDRPVSSIPHA